MAEKRPWALISFGVLVIVCALSYYIYLIELISFSEVIPITITLTGVWTLGLALIRAINTSPYEMSAFGTASWGILISTVGATWLLIVRGFPLTLLVVSAVIVGILVVVTGLREWSGK